MHGLFETKHIILMLCFVSNSWLEGEVMKQNKSVESIHSDLTKIVEEYIIAIKEQYGEYMHPQKLEQLNSITDYGSIIRIHDYGNVNGYANYYSINVPLSVEKIFKKFKFIPFYGINKKHKTYNEDTLIINNNTFMDYVIHVFISGTDVQGYYEDLLLHETMHFCGSGGATALKEGINELLTRKIALMRGFRTTACGYPKEVKIAYELQQIFGEQILDQIAFVNDHNMIIRYLERVLGKEEALLYKHVAEAMDKEFQEKYHKYINGFDGVKGVFAKVRYYKKIDYSKAYKFIEEYKNRNRSRG